MFLRKSIPIVESEKSTEKKRISVFILKNGELKGDKITDDNDDIVKYGNDFINFKIISQFF